MDNLIFSLNATIPIFLLIVIGYFLKLIGWVSEDFANKMNTFVFKVSLPLALFYDLASVEFEEAWDGKLVVFCLIVTILSILISYLISRIFKNKSIRGEFIQATYRSSAAILGVAFIQNLYGNSSAGTMMIIGAVPLYNIFAVIVLSLTSPENENAKLDGKLIKDTLIKVVTNPILIGVIAGLLWSALNLPTPTVMMNTVSKIGATATPLGLMAMGACLNPKTAFESGKEALLATFMKLVGYGLIFIPIAYALGFRNEDIVAILVMLGSATTVSCYVMAKNMGHDGTLTSTTVMLTTLLASVTLTVWIFVLRTLGVV